jgi:hypothetical protein
LRYRLPAGVTDLCSLQIEVRGEYRVETLGGNLLIAPQLVASKVFGLNLRGLLVPRREATAVMRPPMMSTDRLVSEAAGKAVRAIMARQ